MQLYPYVTLIRPKQWLKNLMLLFAPFLSGSILRPGVLEDGIIPFAAFCVVSSAGYVFNDLLDHRQDKLHPVKKKRPVAAGDVSVTHASVLCAILLLCGLLLAGSASGTFWWPFIAYILLSLAYSYKLKELPIVDIFCISAGFLLRLEAGGAVFSVRISEWLFLSVFFLALFLSTGKRLSEKNSLKEEAAGHRKALMYYPPGFLDAAMYMTASTVLLTYTMYVISRQVEMLIYTVPLCCFGLLRYILRVKAGLGGDPTDSLLHDMPLFVVSVLWAIIVALSIYSV